DHGGHARCLDPSHDVVVVGQRRLVDHAWLGLYACPLNAEPEGVHPEPRGLGNVSWITVPEVHGVAVGVLDRGSALLDVAAPVAVREVTLDLEPGGRYSPVEIRWHVG